MNSRHKMFVQAYTDKNTPYYRNASASARKAGYSVGNANKTGCVLLKRKEIRDAIMEAEGKALDIRKEKWYENKLEYIMEGLRNYMSLPSNSQIKYKYYELIAKMQGYIEQTTPQGTICSITINGGVEKFAIGVAQTLTKPNAPNELEKPKPNDAEMS